MSEVIDHAADLIRSGGLVAFPTETVYGLGADAFNPTAVARIFELKGRPRFDPLIVHIADSRQVDDLADEVPEAARRLAGRFWPGPLTIVVTKKPIVPDIVTAGLSTVAVRMPDHPLALDLIRAAGRPIAAPSANRFGRVSPTTAAHVAEQFGADAPLILDGGPCRVGVESTIVSFAGPVPVLLRPGGAPAEAIRAIVGRLNTPASQETRVLSPGRMPKHYGPNTPLVLASPAEPAPSGRRAGLISLRKPLAGHGFDTVEVLSESGDLCEAAANLFSAMRRLDERGLDLIVAHLVPDHGLGLAINDRLRKAAGGDA